MSRWSTSLVVDFVIVAKQVTTSELARKYDRKYFLQSSLSPYCNHILDARQTNWTERSEPYSGPGGHVDLKQDVRENYVLALSGTFDICVADDGGKNHTLNAHGIFCKNTFTP